MKAHIKYASELIADREEREEELKQLEDLLQILKKEGKCIIEFNADSTLSILVYDYYIE